MNVIPFWILDFGFWIAECLTGKLFTNPFVAIIFPIGISRYGNTTYLNME
jgi:hypothetical protein